MQLLSTPVPLNPEREAAITGSIQELEQSFLKVPLLQFQARFDPRGHTAMWASMKDRSIPAGALAAVSKDLRPQCGDVMAYATRLSPVSVLERSQLYIDLLREELPLLSADRFRLAVIERGLRDNPQSIDPHALTRTFFEMAERRGAVTVATITADLLLSARAFALD